MAQLQQPLIKPASAALPTLRVLKDQGGRSVRPSSSPEPVRNHRATRHPQQGLVGTRPQGLTVDDLDEEDEELVDLVPPLSGALAAPPTGTSLRATAPNGRKKYAYAKGKTVVLSKDQMEFELKQMRSFNRGVYETRVRQKYLEERVTRALWTQRLAMRRHEELASQRHRQMERIAKEVALKTPFLRDKARMEQEVLEQAAERAYRAPRFRDLDAIAARLAASNLASRGIGPTSNLAKPASVYDLTVRETKLIPPNSSLMNPRNQVTSPLPDKKFLMPYAITSSAAEAPSGAPAPGTPFMALQPLLAQMVEFFDAKRLADLDAERRNEPRPSLLQAVRAHLSATGDSEDRVREQLAALRFGCGVHSQHPRVALFRAMAGWGEDGKAWEATKASACLLLMMWLRPPADDATKVSMRFAGADVARLLEAEQSSMLRLEDVDTVLEHLRRKRLVGASGVQKLRDAAAALHFESSAAAESSADQPAVVSVDAVLLRWMSLWGSWDWTEDRDLLMSVIARFQGRPLRSPSAGSRSSASTPTHGRVPRRV